MLLYLDESLCHWRPGRTTVRECCRVHSSSLGLHADTQRHSDSSYWGGTALWKRKPSNGRRQQQPWLKCTLLVSVCVLYTYCYQVGQVIYVYIHSRDFYECIYIDVLSMCCCWSRGDFMWWHSLVRPTFRTFIAEHKHCLSCIYSNAWRADCWKNFIHSFRCPRSEWL